jgi:uncharacterized OB-fold protein
VRRPVSPAFADDVLYVAAVVTLAEGPTMMTSIVGCAPEKVPIGMPVEVTSADWTGGDLDSEIQTGVNGDVPAVT